jgi:hypothetical protein
VEGVFRYEPEAVERSSTYSALKPYVIQKFCIHAVNRMLEEAHDHPVADVDRQETDWTADQSRRRPDHGRAAGLC